MDFETYIQDKRMSSARSSYRTAGSSFVSQYESARPSFSVEGPTIDRPLSLFQTLLQEHGLIVPPDKQLYWSDEGQHPEFFKGEDIPLDHIRSIFRSHKVTIDEVRCKRIRLARKTMVCNRKLTLASAIQEIQHLHRLNHSHITQLVGSYVLGRKFAILLYPVADMPLSEFLDNTAHPTKSLVSEVWRNQLSLIRFFGCLASALHHIHSRYMRHMDIKPANILVRAPTAQCRYHAVYIADFGISRSFLTDDSSQTAGFTPRTPRYCSPEVFNQNPKGRSSDIFSMGCVFAEMLTVLVGSDLDSMACFLKDDDAEDGPYHANLPRLYSWLDQLRTENDIDLSIKVGEVKKMLDENPGKRLESADLVRTFIPNICCSLEREAFTEREVKEFPCLVLD
jgi:serine/threonine protein kinase